MASTRIGQKHKWRYDGIWRETKIKPGVWKFNYSNTKSRQGNTAPYGSGFPLKGKLHWKIYADQYAIKISPNKYKTVIKGTKKIARYQLKKRKRLPKRRIRLRK